MKCAVELAKIYGENEEEAEFAGLIHDIAKEMPKDEIKEYVKSHNIEVDEVEEKRVGLLHAKIGANIAKEEYGASEKIVNAIKYHTTGNVDMDMFAKIIFVADKIEENRHYDGVEERRVIAKENLDKVIIAVLDDATKGSIEEGKLIHPESINVRNKLLLLQ